MQTSFLSVEEIEHFGFKSAGMNLQISSNAKFYSPETISLGDNVRIDDFSILSGNIKIGSYVHVSAYCGLYGKLGIVLKDFSGLSPRVTMFSAMDDFMGEYLINPILPSHLTNVTGGTILIERFCQIGSGSIIFPNLKISEGSVVGALSLVKKSLDKWGIYAGIPAKKVNERKKILLEKYKEYFK